LAPKLSKNLGIVSKNKLKYLLPPSNPLDLEDIAEELERKRDNEIALASHIETLYSNSRSIYRDEPAVELRIRRELRQLIAGQIKETSEAETPSTNNPSLKQIQSVRNANIARMKARTELRDRLAHAEEEDIANLEELRNAYIEVAINDIRASLSLMARSKIQDRINEIMEYLDTQEALLQGVDLENLQSSKQIIKTMLSTHPSF